MDLIEQINAHQCLYLIDIGEPKDNMLRLVVQEARANIPSRQDRSGEIFTRGWSSIVPTSDCAAYEIVFSSYIVYSVWNESFATGHTSEIYAGHLFRVYSKSRFLDHVSSGSLVCDVHPGPYQHFEIVCLNHIVDVASVDRPSVTVLQET